MRNQNKTQTVATAVTAAGWQYLVVGGPLKLLCSPLHVDLCVLHIRLYAVC